MTVHYADPELEVNIPLATVDVDGGEKATLHAIHSLPEQVESDISNTASRLATIVTSLSAISGFVDGLEALASTLNGLVDGLETALGAGAAQDRTTAAAPNATRLSTGSAFYDAAKTGQLPTALGATTGALSLSVVHATDDALITDTVGSATALGALNASCSAGTLKGKRSAGFILVGGGSLVGTLTAECFVTTYTPTLFFDPLTGVTSSSLTVNASASDIVRGIVLVPGTTNLRVKVTSYTSGTSNGAVSVSNAEPTLGMLQTLAPPSVHYGGKVTVVTPGTRVQFPSQPLTRGVLVRALTANAGLVFPGNASVSSSAGGNEIAAGEPMWFDASNLNLLWLDAAIAGEGVKYNAW